MGYVAVFSGTDKLVLPSSPQYYVLLRKCLSRAQLKQAESLLTQAVIDMQGNGSVKPDVAGYRNAMVLFSLADWNLDDENGNVLPITPATVDMLAGPDFDAVWNRVDELNSDMEPEDQARFPEAG